MADGLNEARAMRLYEIMGDVRNIQHYLSDIRVNPSAEEANLYGYKLLQQCMAEARVVLERDFSQFAPAPGGDVEQERVQLRHVILDASTRRFQCQKIYLQATAVLRWINNRIAILGGHQPHPAHAPALHAADQRLMAELATVTDDRVITDLRNTDHAQGKWIAEDPPLAMILQWLSHFQ